MSVRVELEGMLKRWADIQSPKISILWESSPDFLPPKGEPFIAAYVIPNGIIDVTVDGLRQREIGIFQLNIYVEDGKGMRKGEEIARQLVSLFPIVPKMSNGIQIERTPQIRPYVKEKNYKVIPVEVFWRKENNYPS